MNDTENNQQYWKGLWSDDKAFWHKEEAHKDLINNFDKLDESMKDKTILFPLCGKSVDMYHCFNKMEMNVIGIELVDQAIVDFFKQHELNYQKIELNDKVNLYQSDKQNRFLKIYQGDLFDITNLINQQNLPLADYCFDRGALTAIHPELRNQYVSNVLNILKPKAKILLNCFGYDLKFQNGPPHSIYEDTVKQLYSPLKCNITLIDSYQSSFKQLTPATYNLFLIEKQ